MASVKNSTKRSRAIPICVKTTPQTVDTTPKEAMVFSRLIFDDEETSKINTRSHQSNYHEGRKSLLPKNPAQALAKLQRRQDQIASIRENDPVKAAAMEDHDSWAKAIIRAQGVAVRDDPKLLKRALKRTETRKQKAKAKWDDMKQGVQEEKQAKQERRRDNLEARKAGKPTERAPKQRFVKKKK